MSEESKTGDQLPEEGPAHLVPDDVPDADEGAAREAAGRQAIRGNRSGHAPGTPRKARGDNWRGVQER